jgi:hypothetical protein
MALYRMIVRHDIDIYQTLNKFANKNDKIIYGFAWSMYRVREINASLEKENQVF